MTVQLSADRAFMDICRRMYAIQATKSVANTGAGKRQDGAVFETLMLKYWERVAEICSQNGCSVEYTADSAKSKKFYAIVSKGSKKLILPASPKEAVTKYGMYRASLKIKFKAKEILAQYPSLEETILSWAPDEGRFAGAAYIKQFQDKATEFDDTALKIVGDTLEEKLLLEYKTSKSSKGKSIDGNAHERLSFQMMQYSEIAPLYSKCSLMVFSNGAFGQFENKYHMFFRLQMERLKVLAGFQATFNSSVSEYVRAAESLARWLLT